MDLDLLLAYEALPLEGVLGDLYSLLKICCGECLQDLAGDPLAL